MVMTTASDLSLPSSLELYDLTGRLIKTEKLTSTNQSILVNTTPGIYVGRLVVEGQTMLVNRLVID
jgi:hypothetical protein